MGGRHRGTGRARGISTGPIVALVTVLLLVLAVLGWFQLRDRIDEQATRAAETCVEGDRVLHIAADPLIAPALDTLAAAWTRDAPRVIRDHCITARVTATATAPAVAALHTDDGWNPDLGPAPALWVPFDSRALDRAGIGTDTQRRSLALSPIGLAVPADLATALTAADVGWHDIPQLQRDPTTLADLGLDRWGTLRAALPTGAQTDATGPVLEAVAAAAADAGSGPLTLAQAGLPAALGAVNDLALGANALDTSAGSSTGDALTALAGHPDPGAPLHAVPVAEKQLRDTPGTGAGTLTVFLPRGATPVADFPATVLDADRVDETLARAADEFVDYVRRPEQTAVLTDAGFRVDGPDLPVTVLAPADAAVGDLLRDVRLNPMSPRKTTLLVDTSTATTPRDLTATSDALGSVVARLPSTSVLGLYLVSDTTSPYRTAVIRDGLTDSQRQALTTALDNVTPTATTSLYPAIIAAYRDAVANYDPTRPNSLLVVVGGPDSGTTTGTQLLDRIEDITDPRTPVRIDIVTLGDTDTDTDTDTLTALADATGGSVTATTAPDLTDTLRKLMA